MIPKHLTYFVVIFFTILFPFIFSFTKLFDFRRYWKQFFTANIFVSILYLIWDSIYTKIGVWGFDYQYTFGLSFFGLPLEEILFFICVPFACLFTYYCFRKFIFNKISFDGRIFWLLCAFAFLAFGLLNAPKLYTLAAFTSCFFSFTLAYYFNTTRFFHFLLFYGVILFPFFLTNGILTGSFLNRVVVFYNDNENVGRRIMTIPIEDIFYGMAMLHFNILGFEYLILKNNKTEK